MATTLPINVVIDTNVVLESLTKQGSAPGLVIDAWLTDLFAGDHPR